MSRAEQRLSSCFAHDAQVHRFMTVPGIGPITALAFKATIDDPARFARSRADATLQARSTGVVAVVMPCCAVIYSKQPGFC